MAGVLVGLAFVLIVLIAILLATRHSNHHPTPPATSTTTSSSTSSTTSSTSTSTTAPTTTTSSTSTTSTTSTTAVAAAGTRPASPGEQAAIASDVGSSHPGYQITLERIANSDQSYVALQYEASGQQTFEEVRHLTSGHWAVVSQGSAQVACDPSIPASVQADFETLPGFGSC